MSIAPINRILNFSLVDGPGSRSVIFVQGCNYHCLYCHNPETQNICRGCGVCVDECPSKALELRDDTIIWHHERCTGCDCCINVCPEKSSPKAVMITAQECAEQILHNKDFIRGVTVSGGECTLYPEFIQELFEITKRNGLNNLLDSNGSFAFFENPELLKHCDGVMLDIKAWSGDKYRRLTGAERPQIEKNLLFLHKSGKLSEIRIVVEKTCVDAVNILEMISNILPDIAKKKTRLRLITYRPFGVLFKLRQRLEIPTEKEMADLIIRAKQLGWGDCSIT